MPEITLCRYCKQSVNRDVDDYVVVWKAVDRFPEELAHAACEQKRPTPFGIEEWMRNLRWFHRS
jgi:hypothetical protein